MSGYREEMKIEELYTGSNSVNIQKERYSGLAALFNEKYGSREPMFFSSPGRIEVGGNHTDHNNGCILAAAIDIDTIAAAAENQENRINLYSKDLNEHFTVDLSDLNIRKDEAGKTSGLIRGIAAKLRQEGFKTGGFDCVLESRIGIGSGLSSSASVEVLIGTILNCLYNDSAISFIDLAKYGQYAENHYFGKPCGLMDQLAIAAGGAVAVDFYDKERPKVEKIDLNLSGAGFAAVIVNTGGTHADLTDDYASVPAEMKAVAKKLGKELLRFTSREDLMDNLSAVRSECGDRAVLRALHFFGENERAVFESAALREGNIGEFLRLVAESGNSSARWLQNTYSSRSIREQNIPLALEMTEYYMKRRGSKGAGRVHGGGFAGTILAFIETGLLEDYIAFMNGIFGRNSVMSVSIRNHGACRVVL